MCPSATARPRGALSQYLRMRWAPAAARGGEVRPVPPLPAPARGEKAALEGRAGTRLPCAGTRSAVSDSIPADKEEPRNETQLRERCFHPGAWELQLRFGRFRVLRLRCAVTAGGRREQTRRNHSTCSSCLEREWGKRAQPFPLTKQTNTTFSFPSSFFVIRK